MSTKVLDIFGSIFLLSQKLQYITDNELSKDNLTTKQFLVLAAVDKSDTPPTLNDVGNVLATSHQNIKQIANQLVKKGFMEYMDDPADKRKVLLRTTKKNKEFWKHKEMTDMSFFTELFGELSDDEVDELYRLHGKLMTRFNEIYTELRN